MGPLRQFYAELGRTDLTMLSFVAMPYRKKGSCCSLILLVVVVKSVTGNNRDATCAVPKI